MPLGVFPLGFCGVAELDTDESAYIGLHLPNLHLVDAFLMQRGTTEDVHMTRMVLEFCSARGYRVAECLGFLLLRGVNAKKAMEMWRSTLVVESVDVGSRLWCAARVLLRAYKFEGVV